MSDLPQDQMTPEEIAELRAESQRLRSELDAERAAREAEARRADGLQQHVSTSDKRLAENEVAGLAALEQQADNAIATATSHLERAQKDIAELNAEGKFEEAAALQVKIGDLAAERQQARQAKAHYAQQRERAAAMPTDPVERFLAANTGFNDAEREWIKRNPRYATDGAFRDRVNRAHVESGKQPGTVEYFSALEQAGYMRPPQRQAQNLGGTAGGGDTGEGEAGGDAFSSAAGTMEDETMQTRQPPRSSGAARPSSRVPTSQNQRQTTILSPDEADVALSLSELMPEDVQNAGDAGIYKFYNDLKHSAWAKRRRADWAG